MNCPNCSTKLKPGANFCTACGNKVVTGNFAVSRIKLVSDLPGKRVYVDGIQTEYTTPCELQHLKPGRYGIHVEDDEHYSDVHTTNVEADTDQTVEFKLQEKVSVKFLSKHVIHFKAGYTEFSTNEYTKMGPGNYKAVPHLKNLPPVKFSVQAEPKFQIVDYDKQIDYTVVEFLNFPDTIRVGFTLNNLSEGEVINIDPEQELKFSHSTRTENIESHSKIMLLPGMFRKLTWTCESIKRTVILGSGEKNISIDFAAHKTLREKRNRRINSWSVLGLVISIIFIAGPALYESILWKRTTEKNTLESYRDYIFQYYIEIPVYNGMEKEYRKYPFSRNYFRHEHEAKEKVTQLELMKKQKAE